jgi:hypothetical protein
VNINEIQIDFINELQPAECSELDFKKKWADYEWENKVARNGMTYLEIEQFNNTYNR